MAAFVSRYARAFADVVAQVKLDPAVIDAQLTDFLAAWECSGELAAFFSNPVASAAQKIEFLDKLNARLGLQKELRNLLAVLIRNGRIAQVKEVIAAYRLEMQARSGVRQAEVITARALNESERAEVTAGVAQLAGAQVSASFSLDESILGGAVVRIGSTVYDGSVRGRLERLKETLVSS
jgi:F-type H+-transporting ATPase subunit delta